MMKPERLAKRDRAFLAYMRKHGLPCHEVDWGVMVLTFGNTDVYAFLRSAKDRNARSGYVSIPLHQLQRALRMRRNTSILVHCPSYKVVEPEKALETQEEYCCDDDFDRFKRGLAQPDDECPKAPRLRDEENPNRPWLRFPVTILRESKRWPSA